MLQAIQLLLGFREAADDIEALGFFALVGLLQEGLKKFFFPQFEFHRFGPEQSHRVFYFRTEPHRRIPAISNGVKVG